MSDLKSARMIVLKGVLFALMALVCAVLIFLQLPSAKTAVLLSLLAWASARFYYFLFYVLERWVDPSLRYSGVFHLCLTVWKRRS